jgi:hypothetical protein
MQRNGDCRFTTLIVNSNTVLKKHGKILIDCSYFVDSEFRHNIIYGAGGAAFLTEDGNEYMYDDVKSFFFCWSRFVLAM